MLIKETFKWYKDKINYNRNIKVNFNLIFRISSFCLTKQKINEKTITALNCQKTATKIKIKLTKCYISSSDVTKKEKITII